MRFPFLLTMLVPVMILGVATSPAAGDHWSILGIRQERGSGDITSEKRNATDFERIKLSCSADLKVTIGEPFQVTVTTDDNLQDNIITEVSGRRTLVIESEGSFSTRRGVLVEITMPDISLLELDGSGDVDLAGLKSEALEIELDGSGDVEFDGTTKDLQISIGGSGDITGHELTAEKVRIETSGSGDVELRGKATEVECIIEGSGNIDVSRLEANTAFASVDGSGNISVFARDSFEGTIDGSGDIDLYGDPKDVDRHVAGSGDIRRRH
jgi:hypothetical protein